MRSDRPSSSANPEAVMFFSGKEAQDYERSMIQSTQGFGLGRKSFLAPRFWAFCLIASPPSE